MQFSLLDFIMNGTCDGMKLQPPRPINVATLPCESRTIKNAREHNFSF